MNRTEKKSFIALVFLWNAYAILPKITHKMFLNSHHFLFFKVVWQFQVAYKTLSCLSRLDLKFSWQTVHMFFAVKRMQKLSASVTDRPKFIKSWFQLFKCLKHKDMKITIILSNEQTKLLFLFIKMEDFFSLCWKFVVNC